MSSDDSDSDFDKEAEREKLREKYEEDQKDRENTQRMSELLLQGATMTGKHCGNCGDPIFRYDGQEFCPTCQREVGGEDAGRAADESAADRNAGDQNAADTEQGSARSGRAEGADESGSDRAADESAGSGDEPRVEINDVRVADQHADASGRRSPPSQQEGGRSNRSDAGTPRTHDPTSHARTPTRDSGPRAHDAEPNREPAPRSPDIASGDLGEARSSLVRTLNDLTRRAEATDDVSRRRELLAATREAAEALAALDRANR